jgi:hypothetical protein
MTSFLETQAKSAKYGPIGCCRRNFTPSILWARNNSQTTFSARLPVRRRSLARSIRSSAMTHLS